MQRRPSGLTTVCVLAIVLGGLQLLTAALSLGSLALSSTLQKAFTVRPGVGTKMDDLQADMQAATYQVADRYKIANFLVYGVQFVLAACLLAGAVGVLQGKSGAWKILYTTLLLGIAFELMAAVPLGMFQYETAQVTQQFMGKITTTAGNGNPPPPGMDSFMKGAGVAVVVLMFAFLAVMILLKVGCYAFSARYLNRPEIKALFARS